MKANSAGSILRRLAAAGAGADVVSGAELTLARRAGIAPHDIVMGVSTQVGSMLRQLDPYLASARAVCEVARAWTAGGAPLEFVDFGGGYGIDYGKGDVPPPHEFAARAKELLREQGLASLELVVEPGRSLFGAFGALVARVIQSKVTHARRWVMINAGMNDMIRPALYGAHHRIEPLERLPGGESWQVVGPVCESADDFGLHQLGAEPPSAVVVRDVGAYGFTLASEYNGRALPAELFSSGGRVASSSQSPGADAWIERRLHA